MIHISNKKLKNYFKFKNRVPETLQANFIHKFKWKHLQTYEGSVLKHQGVSPRTCKPATLYSHQSDTTC